MTDGIRNGDAIRVRNWVLGTSVTIGLFMIVQLVAALRWAGRVDGQLMQRENWRSEFKADMEILKANGSTALSVLRDHGLEFQELRDRILLQEQRQETLRLDLIERTKDRFTKGEWLAGQDSAKSHREELRRYLEERVKGLELRVEKLEQ